MLYNTRPLQYISQPVLISEFVDSSFQSMDAIIHICDIHVSREVGLLSHRYFLLWQYANNENNRKQFCNPLCHDFVRCQHNARFDLIIFAFVDGSILIYRHHSMQQLRQYHVHWQKITGLILSHDQVHLLSSSLDRRINVWNLGKLNLNQST
jgi:hypothetical protein